MIAEIFLEFFVSSYKTVKDLITKMLPLFLIIALLFTLAHAYFDLKILFNVSSLRDFF